MKNPSIEIRNLSKQYRGTDDFAVKELSLSVYPGEVYGFLGPNGAGKSTTIRMLMNLLSPSAGAAMILGQDVVTESVNIKNDIGYLSGTFSGYAKLTGAQYLKYMSELQRPSDQDYFLELGNRFKADLSKKLGDLSRGNRQKIAIIQAFMHQPSVIILDEPTSGLDPLMQEEFYKLVIESKDRGASVFISSHIMGEVQKICDKVGIIRNGAFIAEWNVHEMSQDAAHTFDVVFSKRAPIAALKNVPGVTVIEHNGNNATMRAQGDLAPLLRELSKHEVLKIDAHKLDLEEIFLKFYEDEGVAK